MSIDDELEKIDVIILCGGRGTRLTPVIGEQPKVLAKIGETAFLDILIDGVLQQGFKRIILCIGYLGRKIREHFDHNRDKNYEIVFSEEERPLGTGGASKKAQSLIRSNPFVVMNGDSICKVDLKSFVHFHIEKQSLLSIVLAHSEAARDYGSISLGKSQRITSFNEKVPGGSASLVSAGIYLMQKDVFSYMPGQDHFSLEYDFFPRIVHNRCYGFLTDGEFIDIGTPERYEKAIGLLSGSARVVGQALTLRAL